MPNIQQWAYLGDRGRMLVCAGKDCARKNPGAFDDLVARADSGGCTVEFVKCQGSCTGPTAVVHDGESLRWFERLDKPKARRDLVAFASGTAVDISERLATRELTGKAHDKANRRLTAQLRRS